MVSIVVNPNRIGGNEMKLLKDTSGKVSSTMIILAVLAVAVIGLAIMGMAPSEEIIEPDVPGVAAQQETSTFTLSFADLGGAPVNDTEGIIVYLTYPDQYADVSAVYTEFDDEGDLVGPYDATDVSGAKQSTISTAGEVTYSVTAGMYESDSTVNTGTDFGIAILDETASTMVAGDFNPEVGKVKINARLNNELTVIMTVVENLPGYFGSEIELAEIGVVQFFNDVTDVTVTGFNMEVANETNFDNEDFTMTARLSADDVEMRDVAVYVEIVEGDMALELDDVEVSVNGDKISGTSLTEVADLESNDPLKDNAPSAVASGTRYAVEGVSVDMTRANENNMIELEIVLSEYSTSDIIIGETNGQMIVSLVGLSDHEDTAMQLLNFDFVISGDADPAPVYV